MTSLRILQVAQ